MPEPMPEPVPEPVPEPMPEPMPEPVPEPVPEPIPEAARAPEPQAVAADVPTPTILTEDTLAVLKVAEAALTAAGEEDETTAAGRRRAASQYRRARALLEGIVELDNARADASGTARALFTPRQNDPRLRPLIKAAKANPLKGGLDLVGLYGVLASECNTKTETGLRNMIGYTIQLCLQWESFLRELEKFLRGR
jgi:hypothetical protein